MQNIQARSILQNLNRVQRQKIKKKIIKKNKKDKSYNNFKINSKELILKIDCELDIENLCRLDDGRLVGSLSNNNIIVFNKRTFKSDIIIKEIDSSIDDIFRLVSNILAICIKDTKLYYTK